MQRPPTAGFDVPAMLAKVGIQLGDTGEQVSIVALAYAAHKASSPIRFPPTVALTPVVARWLAKARGSTPDKDEPAAVASENSEISEITK